MLLKHSLTKYNNIVFDTMALQYPSATVDCNIQRRASLTVGLAMAWFSFSSSMTTSQLGRKSTATQVYNYLSQNGQLAPYVSTGGTAVVTGGNSGIGREAVCRLAEAGMNVVLCARNLESAAEVKDSLPEDERGRVEIQHMDLSSLESIQKAAESISSKYKNVDCLINNAAIMALPKRETTVDGVEMQFGTNHVGHHFLTRLLLPHLNENGRVVTVASTAHTLGTAEDWESTRKYSGWKAYGKSKLANILFASQLQKILRDDRNIASVSLHPGVIASPLWKHSLPRFLQPLVGLISNKSVEQGAATTVFCALSSRVEGGAYYADCAVDEPSAAARDAKNQESLWEYTEKLFEKKGFKVPAMTFETASESK